MVDAVLKALGVISIAIITLAIYAGALTPSHKLPEAPPQRSTPKQDKLEPVPEMRWVPISAATVEPLVTPPPSDTHTPKLQPVSDEGFAPKKNREKNLCERYHGRKVVTGRSWHCVYKHRHL